MILMIDNFDSFTYNLVQYLMMMGSDVKVVRNNAATLEEIRSWNPGGIAISPGPGRPDSAGISMPVIREFSGKLPILGVCLGHQSLVAAFGGAIIKAKRLMHGKVSLITCDGKGIFRGLPETFEAMRYHSLAAAEDELPDCFEITARSEDGEIMGVRHIKHPSEGIQFHPESIMTKVGKRILRNFMNICNEGQVN